MSATAVVAPSADGGWSGSARATPGAGSGHDLPAAALAPTAVAVPLADRPGPAAVPGARSAAEPHRPDCAATRARSRPAHVTSANGLSGPPVRTQSPGGLGVLRPPRIGFHPSTL